MKTSVLVLVATIALTSAGSARAGGEVGLFTDMAMTNCELVDNSFTLRTIYVFYTGTSQAVLIRFAAPKPDCWQGATWVGDIVPPGVITIGVSQVDWTLPLFPAGLGYWICRTPPVWAGSINFVAAGAALPCCEMVAKAPGPPPQPQWFIYDDCTLNEIPLDPGQKVVINPNDSCRCQNPLPVRPTTWGGVKALYR